MVNREMCELCMEMSDVLYDVSSEFHAEFKACEKCKWMIEIQTALESGQAVELTPEQFKENFDDLRSFLLGAGILLDVAFDGEVYEIRCIVNAGPLFKSLKGSAEK